MALHEKLVLSRLIVVNVIAHPLLLKYSTHGLGTPNEGINQRNLKILNNKLLNSFPTSLQNMVKISTYTIQGNMGI